MIIIFPPGIVYGIHLWARDTKDSFSRSHPENVAVKCFPNILENAPGPYRSPSGTPTVDVDPLTLGVVTFARDRRVSYLFGQLRCMSYACHYEPVNNVHGN